MTILHPGGGQHAVWVRRLPSLPRDILLFHRYEAGWGQHREEIFTTAAPRPCDYRSTDVAGSRTTKKFGAALSRASSTIVDALVSGTGRKLGIKAAAPKIFCGCLLFRHSPVTGHLSARRLMPSPQQYAELPIRAQAASPRAASGFQGCLQVLPGE